MSTKEIDADRTDMIAYMTEASENGEWVRPSLHPISETSAKAILGNTDVTQLYILQIGIATIEAWRIDGTNDVVHIGRNPERDRTIYRTAFYGEAALDLRYWLLQAEINDKELSIVHAADDVVETVKAVSPVEWESQITELLEKYK